MTRREITRKFDEIVAFAGVERYIDTPVKRYSSGMYVRLAFAVAAHLESEILIIDEVLAVGDAEFQKKCLGKMNDVSKGEGRTVLFVSHNMGSIRALCKKGIYLLNGSVGFIGSINATIDKYTNQPTLLGSLNNEKDKIQIKSVSIANQLRETKALEFGDTLIITLNCYVDGKVDKSYIWVGVDSKYGSLFGANTLIDGHSLPPISGSFSITLKFPELYLLPQEYIISCGAREADGHTLLMTTSEIGFFSIVSSVQELGLNGPLAEQLAPNSAPLLWSYEMFINGNIFASFNPKDLK
jgi:lipopolysaccharide transport system ATP-binding protein